jgi:hypothetical protein
MNLSPLRECATGREPEYVSVHFQCDEQFDTDELPPFVDTEGRECNHANDLPVQSGHEPDQLPA